MARVSRGVQAHAKHKKVLKKAKGYYGARSKVYRVAKQAVIKAGNTPIVTVVNVVVSSVDYGLYVLTLRQEIMA